MHLLLWEDTEDPQNTARAVHLHVPLLVCLLDRYKYLFKYGRLCQWKADLNLIQWTQTNTRPQHRQCRVQLYIEEVPRFHNIRNQSKQWRYRLGGYDLSFIYDNTSMSNNLQVNCKDSTFYCVFYHGISNLFSDVNSFWSHCFAECHIDIRPSIQGMYVISWFMGKSFQLNSVPISKVCIICVFLKDEESANTTWEVVFPLALFFFYFLKFFFGLLINWMFDMVNSSTV